MYKMWILDFIMHAVYVLTYISIDQLKTSEIFVC